MWHDKILFLFFCLPSDGVLLVPGFFATRFDLFSVARKRRSWPVKGDKRGRRMYCTIPTERYSQAAVYIHDMCNDIRSDIRSIIRGIIRVV
ncbi:hypothetical protein F5Y11DRAFT_313562 [Daldinia sp. FL1419]|nr:hypothetical protein F5Y11DRAFT_313562 [Daldinia sp. FL1419]